MKVWALVLGGIILVVMGAGVAYGIAERTVDERVRAASEIHQQKMTAALKEAIERHDDTVRSLAQRFQTIDDLKTAQELALRRSRNADHLRLARELGAGRVAGFEQAEMLVKEGRLVRLTDTDYYYLQEFDYSIGYVTPDMALFLEELGKRFHERLLEEQLPRYRYNISSVLRTAENQRGLRMINPNATGGVSAHEYATTVDIVYHTYEYVPSPEDAVTGTGYSEVDDFLERTRVRLFDGLGMQYWQELQGILGRILIDMQREGFALVMLEREQPVFHITVARRLAK